MAPLNADLDAIIAHAATVLDAGHTVKIGGVSGAGVFRREEVTAMNDSGELRVIGIQYTLTVREGVFANLAQDVAVEVDGAHYKIRNPGKQKTDGTRKVLLVEASP